VTTDSRRRSREPAGALVERMRAELAGFTSPHLLTHCSRLLDRIVAIGARWRRRAPVVAAPPTDGEPSVWLVDGYNVLHAGVLRGRDRARWWTEPRRRELLERVSGFDAEAEVWVVFDGPGDSNAALDPHGTHCVFAKSADAWLIERVRSAEDPAAIAVVTSDRQVAGRARGRGARVVSPRDFLSRCARQ